MGTAMMTAKERMENCLPLFQHSFRDAGEKQLTEQFQAAMDDALEAAAKSAQASLDFGMSSTLVAAIRALKSGGSGTA